MIVDKAIVEPFESYIMLAENVGSITGGPKPRANLPGIDVRVIWYPDTFEFKQRVIKCIQSLLHWVNKKKVLETSGAISAIKAGTELGKLCLMLILQICTLSSVVLCSSTKLLNLLYPIPGKGLANHLLDLNVHDANHQDALKRVLHHFNLEVLVQMLARVFYVNHCLDAKCMMFFFRAESISNECSGKINEKKVHATNLEIAGR
jgi:hypothetical protein